MVGLERSKNYNKLSADPNQPLFDRSIGAAYPPGSTFKTIQALYGLQEKVISAETCLNVMEVSKLPSEVFAWDVMNISLP